MLLSSIKATKSSIWFRRQLPRSVACRCFHRSALQFKKAAEAEVQEDNFALNRFTHSVKFLKSSLLNAPPLRKLTQPNVETLPFTGQADNWEDAIKEAHSLVSSADQERIFDPVKLIGKDLRELKRNITSLLGSGHPFIDTMRKHYLQNDTHRLRPLLVLLMAKATCNATKKPEKQMLQETGEDEQNIDFTSLENPILPSQRKLAEISELIYTSSLLHYDVRETGGQMVTAGFGNKMAILAGDFLLARASVNLAQLKKAECIELMATCLANLAEGEFIQYKDIYERNLDAKKALDYYTEKIYMKTSSLIAQSCKASSVLAGCSDEITNVAYEYGKNFGIALQLIDDIRTFSTTARLDKYQHSNWLTAPVLIAWDEYPELKILLERECKHEGDEEKARLLVYQSSGLKKTLEFAKMHITKAISAIEKLPSSDAQIALVQLANNLPTKKG
ncbi:isoprenoid synthase domain-containing protein [Mycotypha africana]|uniref:isoprenoid synthase domain-containing protein n=1 Tax=Mycotypha africana TaxID=64632 RepID=UPI0022FFC657|nr:isoprenoid synthase domain-containing protein [Mycotypha africana]KAI8991892.1 isoprenoid synthase domain-containing protein [Mycotypha africana]